LTIRKRGGSWHFDFEIRGVRYREAIPEARTKFRQTKQKLRCVIRCFRVNDFHSHVCDAVK